jgi:tetratricopeptide (TPR) repeat protein
VGDRPAALAEVAGKDDPHRMGRLFDLFGIAAENLRGGDAERGIAQLQEVLAADPDNPIALAYLGKAYLIASRRPDLARPLFERALAVNPHQQEARYFLARLLVGEGDLPGARRHVEAILAAQPASVPALLEMAQIAGALGDLTGSRSHLRRALAVAPTDVDVLVALGASHARHREQEEAGRYFRRALDLEPGHPQVLYNVGIWYLQEGDVEQAIARLSRVVEIDPADPDASFVLGRLWAERGERDRARTLLRAARRLAAGPARREEIDRLLAGLDGG